MTEILHADKTIMWVKFNYQRALSCFSECISNSISSPDEADIIWIENIIVKINALIESATSYITRSSVLWQVRCSFLENLEQKGNAEAGSAVCFVDMQINIQVAKEMFKAISIFDNDGAWRNCLSMADEPNRPLSLMRSLFNQCEKLFTFHEFGEVEISDTIEDMENSQKLYRGRSLAFQKRYIGEEILKSLLFEAEVLDMESVWTCIDHYSSSINVLRIEQNVMEQKDTFSDEDEDDDSNLEEYDEDVNDSEDGDNVREEEEEEEREEEGGEDKAVVEDEAAKALSYRAILLRQNLGDTAQPDESSTREGDNVGDGEDANEAADEDDNIEYDAEDDDSERFSDLGEDEEAYLCYEGVACACSFLGGIFEKVLKMEDKAHDYFLRSVQYADIVTHTSGAVFFHVEWYKIAQRGVQGYRRRREGFDLSAIAKQREPFLLILKPKIEVDFSTY